MVAGPVGGAEGVFGGVLGGDPTRDRVGEPGGVRTVGGLVLGATTLEGAGLTGNCSGDLGFSSESGSNGNIIGAGLSLGVSLGSAVGVVSPSDSDFVPSKGSLVFSKAR